MCRLERSVLELFYVLRAALASGGNGVNDYNCPDKRNACCNEKFGCCPQSDRCSRVRTTLCVVISTLIARFEHVYSLYSWFDAHKPLNVIDIPSCMFLVVEVSFCKENLRR
jgi:hypothetical protein